MDVRNLKTTALTSGDVAGVPVGAPLEVYRWRCPHPELGDVYGEAKSLLSAKRAVARISTWDGGAQRRAEIKGPNGLLLVARCPKRKWLWVEADR
jgi:hypothetical protein